MKRLFVVEPAGYAQLHLEAVSMCDSLYSPTIRLHSECNRAF